MAAPRVLISDAMSSRAAEVLADAGVGVDVRPDLDAAGLTEALGEYDGLLIRSRSQVTAETLAGSTRLKVVGRAGIGVDNVDLAAATAAGVAVMNTPGGNANAVAEFVLGLMLAMARNIPAASASMQAGRWDKKRLGGWEIKGRTLGIIGLGHVGRLLATRCVALGMHVVAYDPFLSEAGVAAAGADKVDLATLFQRSDVITCHTPLTPKTKGMIGPAAFKKMKRGAVLINAARGGVVDEMALFEALQAGRVSGAALDVFAEEPPAADHPLRSHPGVILTPHLAASTGEAQVAVAVQIAEQVAAYLVNGKARNVVNRDVLRR
jgi:D-3-phosphoglycerate dehydrogenase